ncbi:MAG: GGDEF domain-containing protein [Proteobacteria bacterium]|nr:GGDEF domain-containing protein [Pseudomonadota bacterium]MBU1545890.1 GGDEF domain-containing protein [Pseudomonadota bacterium]MBU2618940.1 GGDEF domain-containing protein [Pseudomonadota bacterium]
MEHNDIERLDRISAHLHALLHNEQPGLLDLTGHKEDEIRQVGQFVNSLSEALSALTNAAHLLSIGDMDVQIVAKLPACHHLKNLQATLRHLTWQTGQIAKGDFSQRVEFLGEFSYSFNWMVEQLDAYRQRILGQNRELERLATTDPLTGVYNRRYFMDFATKEFLRSQRYSHVFSAIQMDIDHFKKINDTHGHAVGDEVIKAFTVMCQEVLRESDMLGRVGGEEFSIILPETDRAGALIVAERIRRAIADLKVYADDHVVRFTVSIGLTSLRQDDAGIEAVLRRADEALYLAKNGGRNKVLSG